MDKVEYKSFIKGIMVRFKVYNKIWAQTMNNVILYTEKNTWNQVDRQIWNQIGNQISHQARIEVNGDE